MGSTSQHHNGDSQIPLTQVGVLLQLGRALMRAQACSSDLAQFSPKMQARISPRLVISVKRLCAAMRMSPPDPLDP